VGKDSMHTSKWSLKLIVVSLINIIIQLFPPCGIVYLEAYNDARELMYLIEWDLEGDNLLSKATNHVVDRLLKTLSEGNGPDKTSPTTTTMEEATKAIKKLANKSKRNVEYSY
jgi:hypothetical protein